jgi:hypothetical protein
MLALLFRLLYPLTSHLFDPCSHFAGCFRFKCWHVFSDIDHIMIWDPVMAVLLWKLSRVTWIIEIFYLAGGRTFVDCLAWTNAPCTWNVIRSHHVPELLITCLLDAAIFYVWMMALFRTVVALVIRLCNSIWRTCWLLLQRCTVIFVLKYMWFRLLPSFPDQCRI